MSNDTGQNPTLLFWFLLVMFAIGIPIHLNDGNTIGAIAGVILVGLTMVGIKDLLGYRSVYFLMLMTIAIESFWVKEYIIAAIVFAIAAWEWRGILNRDETEENE